MAFSNIENNEKLDVINIAIVDDENFDSNEIFKQTFKELSDEENEDRIFNTRYVSDDVAKDLLENSEIVGYLKIQENVPQVVVKTSGISQTVFKYITEEITQTSEIVKNKAEYNINKEIATGNFNIDYEKIYKDALELVQDNEVNIKDISSSNLSYTMIEFYTLIAMACLYGGILQMTAINQNLANMGSVGKRVGVSPVSKIKLVLSSTIASYIIQLIGVAILFVYTIFVLKVNYGENLALIILLAMVGSLAGLSIGLIIGTVLKVNENTKTGIIISITMLGCFLSGMMGITMKYIIDKNIPILNKINPASMITDGFYSLYYYDTLDRYWFNISSLLIFSVIMILVSYFSLRRQKYDSI